MQLLHRTGPAFIALLRVASSFSQKLRVAGVLLVSGKKDKTPLWCEDRFPSHPRCFDTEPLHMIEYACATTQDLKHLSIFAAIMIYSCCLISPRSLHLILSLGSLTLATSKRRQESTTILECGTGEPAVFMLNKQRREESNADNHKNLRATSVSHTSIFYSKTSNFP